MVEEAGRRIVRAETASGGTALPWQDREAFLRRLIDTALADYTAACVTSGFVFFDRGLIDAASALEALTGEAAVARYAAERSFHRHVFLTPPWPEHYTLDDERRHGIADAIAEHDRLAALYPSLGYQICTLPKVSVEARADIVLRAISASAS